MTRAMEYAKDNHGFRSDHEENEIWEPCRQNAPNFRPSAKTPVPARIGHSAFDRGLHFAEKFISQPRSLALIPNCSVGNISFSLAADDEPVGHGCSFA